MLPIESADGCARAGCAAAEGPSIWAKERGGTPADQEEEAGRGGIMLMGAEGRASHVHAPQEDAMAGSGRRMTMFLTRPCTFSQSASKLSNENQLGR